jgi:formylglycine-generating enzyme required for sulfatase activity
VAVELHDFPVCHVAAGNYPIGDDRLPLSRPAHLVKLASFAIGLTAVTNAQFAHFVDAGGYADETLWSEMGWRWQSHRRETHPAFWNDPNFNHPLQPVVGLCWYEADAFARWLSRETGQLWRLPTEVEWEAAARGSGEISLKPAQVNTAEQGLGRTWSALGNGQISWCGARDLCGNVWEWCSTRWGHNWQTLDYPYPYSVADDREDQNGSHARVMRGGSWFDNFSQAHPANRGRYLPGSRGSNIGFRLATLGSAASTD